MAATFVGISLPVVLSIPRELGKGNQPVLLALLFPLAGVGLGMAAARITLRMRKFGCSELELHTLPGVLGGTLTGALEIPVKVRAATGFKLRLTCVRRTTSGSGKNRSTSERVLWEEHKTLVKEFLDHERDRTGLPVFFRVPCDQPQSEAGNPSILWRLDVAATVPGIDYAARFEVPVFRTAESRDNGSDQEDPTTSFQLPPEAWKPPENSRVIVTETPRGSTHIRFPAARHAAVIAGILLFVVVWSLAIGFMVEKGAPVLFPIVFGMFDLLLMGFAIELLFHSVSVVANRSEVSITHRLLLARWNHTLAVGDIQSITLKTGLQSGSRVYYDLKVNTRAGRNFTAGPRVADKKHAEWLMSTIRSATGLDC
jgi:hypothetical protein